MTYPLFSFTSTQGAPNQTAQAGLNQYIQQGQSQINPGQAQVAQSNPIAAGAHQAFANALQQANQQQPQGALPTANQALAMGAQANPNVNGQNMGGVGPTPQNLATAQLLMAQPSQNTTQQFLNPQS